MENASKALIMGAEILVGVMIISIGVYLFQLLGNYSAETTAKITDAQLQQFNAQFTKYYGTTSSIDQNGNTVNQVIKCTMQDIVGVANLASMYNKQNGFEEVQEASDTSYYIQVDVKLPNRTIKNVEGLTQKQLVDLLKDEGNYGIIIEPDDLDDLTAKTKYYKISENGKDFRYGAETKRVNYIKFTYDESL